MKNLFNYFKIELYTFAISDNKCRYCFYMIKIL